MAVLIIALFGSPDADLAPIDPAVPHERIASQRPAFVVLIYGHKAGQHQA
jgi:hypothetical protein